MGNQQSNERQWNWKIFKITEKYLSNDDFVRLYLDDYVTYSDGKCKRFDFKKTSWKTIITSNNYNFLGDVGRYVKIDLNKTSEHSIQHNFSEDEFAISLIEGRVVERTDFSNGNITRDLLEGVSSIRETVEARRQLTATIEQSHRAENASLRWTSWDVPPGWK